MVLTAYNNFSFSDFAEIFILDNDDYIITNAAQNRLSSVQDATEKPAVIADKNKITTNSASETKKITTLTELKTIVENSAELNIEKIANNLCFFTTASQQTACDILIFSDYPNAAEDKTGELFTGGHCELLNKMLKTAQLSSKNITKANLVFWHPLGGAAPSVAQLNLCLPFAKNLINILQPKILLLLGSISSTALANATSLYNLENNIKAKIITSYDVKNIRTITPNMAKHLWQAILNIKNSLT